MVCKNCHKPISPDEVGLTKKLINRGTTEFLCFDCLEAYFKISHAEALALIERFKNAGCTLFH